MFSVIITNYNYGRYLAEAVASVRCQEPPHEIVVVDDGSTDDSALVLDRCASDGCIVLRKPNGGQASAFNLGFSLARGDWIQFLDADDMLLPGALQKIRRRLRPGIGKVHFPLEMFRDEGGGTRLTHRPGDLSRGDVAMEIAQSGRHSWPPTSGNVFSRASLLKILPMPEAEYRISADQYLNTRAPFFGEILAFDEPLARYRVHASNNYFSGSDGAAAKIQQSWHAAKAVHVMSSLLVESGIPHAPDIFDGRAAIADRILARRFVERSATEGISVNALLRRFQASSENRQATFGERLRWWSYLLVLAWAPQMLVRLAITTRDRWARWRTRGSGGESKKETWA